MSSRMTSRVEADLVLIAATDSAIKPVAERLRVGQGTYVAHISGATSIKVLEVIDGARPGCLHPLQTLADQGAEALIDAPVAVTCRSEDRDFFFKVTSDWGGKPFDLADTDKTIYHAAAVFASNYLSVCVAAGATLFKQLGLDSHLLTPLVLESAALATQGISTLTGPAVRGDTETMCLHESALAPKWRDAYQAMARLTSELVS